MSRYIRIYIVRKDGRIQKYRILRKNLKKYVKVSFRQKEKRWIWQSKEAKVKKELKRIKVKKEKLKKFKKPRKMVKQVWHVKLVYDSKKGRKQHHDLVRELRIETIKEKPLTEDEIKQMAEENIDAIIEPLLAKGLPPDFTDIIVGLEEEEEIESEEESIKAELVEYYHKIPENLKRFLK